MYENRQTWRSFFGEVGMRCLRSALARRRASAERKQADGWGSSAQPRRLVDEGHRFLGDGAGPPGAVEQDPLDDVGLLRELRALFAERAEVGVDFLQQHLLGVAVAADLPRAIRVGEGVFLRLGREQAV